ncbi:acyltransferase [Salinicoccus siamensis]|uniref:Probable poly-beta-1,6-N-acetyl-D-glucosamine export protein n=2 Tax=Salinicoccus siamensis TaxID=381830 RepID=A0ABV5Z4E7_9STAP
MIDYVKGFAIFFVVAIHSKTVQGAHIGMIDGDDANFFINMFARFAVPFFFVASGYLFVQKLKWIHQENESGSRQAQFHYFKKYIGKLIKLYVAWFAFYFVFELGVKFIEGENNSGTLFEMFTSSISHFNLWSLIYFGEGAPGYHLWFLPALIYAVLLLFLFVQMRLVGVLFIISIGLHLFGLFGQAYSFLYDVPFNTREGIFFALFYVTFGGVVAKYSSSFNTILLKIPTWSVVISLVVLSCMQVLEGFITLKLYEGKEENYFFFTIPLVMTLFMLALKHQQMGKNSIFTKIGANAVGIYVSHVFIMEFMQVLIHQMKLTAVEDSLLWKVMLTPLVLVTALIFYHQLQNGKKVVKSIYQ